jgi:hypothetical protein
MGFHCDISIYAYNVPGLDSPLHHSPSSPSPPLKTMSIGFIVLWKKVHGSPSLFTLLLPLAPISGQDLFYTPVLSFILKQCPFIVRCGISHIHVLYFIRLTPLVVSLLPVPLFSNSFQCVSLCHLPTQITPYHSVGKLFFIKKCGILY